MLNLGEGEERRERDRGEDRDGKFVERLSAEPAPLFAIVAILEDTSAEPDR